MGWAQFHRQHHHHTWAHSTRPSHHLDVSNLLFHISFHLSLQITWSNWISKSNLGQVYSKNTKIQMHKFTQCNSVLCIMDNSYFSHQGAFCDCEQFYYMLVRVCVTFSHSSLSLFCCSNFTSIVPIPFGSVCVHPLSFFLSISWSN